MLPGSEAAHQNTGYGFLRSSAAYMQKTVVEFSGLELLGGLSFAS